MKQSPLPYQQMIFVCTNAREPGQRVSCAGEGRCGMEILKKLKSFVKENKLEDKVRVAKSGCHEKCEDGPNVVVLPQNDFYTGVSVANAETLIARYLKTFVSS